MRAACSVTFAGCFAAVLSLAASPARGANWFALDALSTTSGLAIEVDTDTLRQIPSGREITVRVTYPQARLHRGGAYFRSVVATVEFRCEGGLGGYRDAVFYSDAHGQGPVAAREDGQSAIPERTRELLPARSLEVLTRAACGQATPATR